MRADGSEPAKLSEHPFGAQAISPDGTLVAGDAWDAERRGLSIGVLEVANPAAVKILAVDPRAIAWFPSGRTLGYVDFKNGADNVWTLPVPNGQPKQVTRFEKRGVTQDGRVIGQFRATGVRPKCSDRLKASGINLPAEMFEGVMEVR